MIATYIERAALSGVIALALLVGCKSPEADKTAKTDKTAPAKKDAPAKVEDDKAKGGGGSDEVEAEPEEVEEPAVDDLEGYDPRVAQAAKVAREIATDPKAADDVLSKENLDREKLDALMYEIASDPDLTEQYRIARGL
jgi:hypothetical protein